MNHLIELRDKNELIPTSSFPYAVFPFESFNPPQSRLFEAYNDDANFLIAANTSAGKTAMAEMILSHEIRSLGGKGMYLAPALSLSQEKVDDWQDVNHHFHDLPISICTGDYRFTTNRRSELDDARIVIMTNEMANSLARNHRSDKSRFLKGIGTLVVDEANLIGDAGRGAHIESCIIKFAEINPKGRLVLLSATMPNTNEIAEWVSTLNGKKTYVLQSSYRPCKLNWHYPKYEVRDSYYANERSKIESALELFSKFSSDKFLFFVHTKDTGRLLKEALSENLVKAEFHNADLDKNDRKKIEKRFKEDDELRAIIATSTLSAGVNLPARRVVVVGVHRAIAEVAQSTIEQSGGRAGRPKYDPSGDAYVLLPDKHYMKQLIRVTTPQLVISQMSNDLAFHLVSEIHHQNIKNMKGVDAWWRKTLSFFQNKSLDLDAVNEVLDRLCKCGAIREENGEFEVTVTGQLSSLFYMSPFDVSDLCRNWNKVFQNENEGDDIIVSMALANRDTYRQNIVSAAEREEIGEYAALASVYAHALGQKNFTEGALKTGCCYHKLLNGKNSIPLGSLMRTLQSDFGRSIELLNAFDGMAGKWDKGQFFRTLGMRMQYGVPEHMVDLCRLDGVGKAKAKKLWDAKLRSLEDISGNQAKVVKALGCSANIADKICRQASIISKT